MQILRQGAEAILYADEFEGQKVLVKERVKKNYRIEEIDSQIRKNRTKEEIKLLTEARKIGVSTPKILNVDYSTNKIFMEFIDGIRLKDFLKNANSLQIKKNMQLVGESVGKLHSINIVHGDLTTSNMLVKNKEIYFIDFGLGFFSKRLEDKAVDLKLLYEALRSTHFKILQSCWKNFIIGYVRQYIGAKEILEQIKEIERRSRYAKR